MDSLKHSFNFQIIRGECDKLVDEFVPELVETLSSEMNPDLVCTTAGLCNSGTQFNKFLSHLAFPRTFVGNASCWELRLSDSEIKLISILALLGHVNLLLCEIEIYY